MACHLIYTGVRFMCRLDIVKRIMSTDGRTSNNRNDFVTKLLSARTNFQHAMDACNARAENAIEPLLGSPRARHKASKPGNRRLKQNTGNYRKTTIHVDPLY